MIELVILTGVYGAGRTLAVQNFEEAGYIITDNIPVAIIDNYFDEIEKHQEEYPKVALTVGYESAIATFESAKKHKNFNVKFVGITCAANVLNERYRLSRRVHPKQIPGVSLEDTISKDVENVRNIRDYFDVFIDTSKLSKNDFRNIIFETCIGANHKFSVSFYSFGYRVSVPQDIETVFDVRLLPNPYWVPELKNLTGLDKPVIDFVLNAPETKEYLEHVIKYLDFYIDQLRKNDRKTASIGFACSGGVHRSVVIANYLARHYSSKYNTTVTHKDLPKRKM